MQEDPFFSSSGISSSTSPDSPLSATNPPSHTPRGEGQGIQAGVGSGGLFRVRRSLSHPTASGALQDRPFWPLTLASFPDLPPGAGYDRSQALPRRAPEEDKPALPSAWRPPRRSFLSPVAELGLPRASLAAEAAAAASTAGRMARPKRSWHADVEECGGTGTETTACRGDLSAALLGVQLAEPAAAGVPGNATCHAGMAGRTPSEVEAGRLGHAGAHACKGAGTAGRASLPSLLASSVKAGNEEALAFEALKNADAGWGSMESEESNLYRHTPADGSTLKHRGAQAPSLSGVMEQECRMPSFAQPEGELGRRRQGGASGPTGPGSTAPGDAQGLHSPSVFLQTALNSLSSLHQAQQALTSLSGTELAQGAARSLVAQHLLRVEEGLNTLLLPWQSTLHTAVSHGSSGHSDLKPLHATPSHGVGLASLVTQSSLPPQTKIQGASGQSMPTSLIYHAPAPESPGLPWTSGGFGKGALGLPRYSRAGDKPSWYEEDFETLVVNDPRWNATGRLVPLQQAALPLRLSSDVTAHPAGAHLESHLASRRGAGGLQARDTLREGVLGSFLSGSSGGIPGFLPPSRLDEAVAELCSIPSSSGKFPEAGQLLLENMGLLGSPSTTALWMESGKADVDPGHDGHRWRKCGKKMIKDAAHPRTYFRCAEEGCPAKKTMQKVPEPQAGSTKGALRAPDGRDSRDGSTGGTRTLVTYENSHDHPKTSLHGGLLGGLRNLGALACEDLTHRFSAADVREGVRGVSQDSPSADVRSLQRAQGGMEAEMHAPRPPGAPLLGTLPRSDWARALLLGSSGNFTTTISSDLRDASRRRFPEAPAVLLAAEPTSSAAGSSAAAEASHALTTYVLPRTEAERTMEALQPTAAARGARSGATHRSFNATESTKADPEGWHPMEVVDPGCNLSTRLCKDAVGGGRETEAIQMLTAWQPAKKAKCGQSEEGTCESGKEERRERREIGEKISGSPPQGDEDGEVRLFGFTLAPKQV